MKRGRVKFKTSIVKQGCRSRGPEGQWPPQILADQLTLYKEVLSLPYISRGELCPPRYLGLPTVLLSQPGTALPSCQHHFDNLKMTLLLVSFWAGMSIVSFVAQLEVMDFTVVANLLIPAKVARWYLVCSSFRFSFQNE